MNMGHVLSYNKWALINESYSKWDVLSNKIVKDVFIQWVKDWKRNKRKSNVYIEIDEELEFDLDCTIYFDNSNTFKVLDSTGADARDEDEEGYPITPFIIIDFSVDNSWLPGYWQEVYMTLSDVIRHEIEHITQDGHVIGNYRKGKPDEDDTFLRSLISNGLLPDITYYLLPKEIDANLQGLRFEAKKRREPMIDTINRYLNSRNLSDEDKEDILKAWRKRAKEIGGIPSF